MTKKPEYVVDMGTLDWTPEERRKARQIVATEHRKSARDVYAKLLAENPRFKEVPKSGKGFVIGAAKPAVARSPAQVAKGLDQAWENFRKDYPDIPEEEARKMWEASGG